MRVILSMDRMFGRVASVLMLCAVAAACGSATDDALYATIPGETAVAPGRLVTLEIKGINKLTTTIVGSFSAGGCASLARSTAGVMYSVCGPGIAKPDLPQQLNTVDLKTGKTTPVGNSFQGLQVMALEFSSDGTLYAVGDGNPASPTFNSLYTVNTTTGAFTRVGSTGVPAPEFIMDFAFDKNGTMYAASSHTLFTIDRKIGTATKVADFVGGGDIMGLSYDAKQNRLYASDWKMPRSALYLVDVQTGFLTPVASIGYPLSHGLVPIS